MLKCYISQEFDSEEQRIYSQPYNIVEIKNNNSPRKSRYVLDSCIDDYEFFSKAFIIRFTDEIIDLDDICHFRAEIDAYPTFNDNDFFLVIELLYADLNIMKTDSPLKNEPKAYTKFKCVSKCQCRLYNSFDGIHEFIPVTFDDMHFCLVSTTVHTILLDFKFRSNLFLNNQNN